MFLVLDGPLDPPEPAHGPARYDVTHLDDVARGEFRGHLVLCEECVKSFRDRRKHRIRTLMAAVFIPEETNG
jgi:hypothetical protein